MGDLSAELQKFLSACETEFADRYTEKDTEYTNYCETSKQAIPIEERWYVKPPRSHHYEERRNRGGSWEHRRHYNDNREHRRDQDQRGWWPRDRYQDRNHPYSRSSYRY